MKHMLVHSSTTLQPQSVRLLLAMAAIFGFDTWNADITQAYLQSTEPLARDIYIARPVTEFELDRGQCLKLLRPLYGLCDAGDLWHATIDKNHRQDLGMKPLRVDPALYYALYNEVLCGMSGAYVDDLLRCGDKSFKNLSDVTRKKFDMKPDESLPA